jgi:DNA replication and repair protein RecF
MKLSSLQIRDFRNFKELQLKFSDGLNVFVGNNGQGKSNLLEAVCLLILNESFRYSDNPNLIRFEQPASYIQGQLEKNGLDYQVQMQILKSRKNITWNNKKIPQYEIRNQFSCIVFSPESLSFIKESADQRRTLVDEALMSIDPIGSKLVADYRKVLKTRNKVLKDCFEEPAKREEYRKLLESLNPLYLRSAADLTLKRINLLKAIYPFFQEAMSSISKGSPVDISVEYLVSGHNLLNPTESIRPQAVIDALSQRLQDLSDAEMSRGTSLVGPHKHEIIFLYNQKDSRFYCSQGQQRALILSFKMAQIVYYWKLHGDYPILLLDDVLSELDFAKRGALIEFLQKIKTQIFLTTTELHLPAELQVSGANVLGENRSSLKMTHVKGIEKDGQAREPGEFNSHLFEPELFETKVFEVKEGRVL